MGTHANIGIRSNGIITYIYCHYDGYVEHTGRILQNFYNSPEVAKALIELGDISSLGELFEKPQEPNEELFYTEAYHRDRSEDYEDTKARVAKSFEEFIDGEDFAYLYNLDEDTFCGTPQNTWGIY